MKIHDISLTISTSLPVWPGDPAIHMERVAKIELGANANLTSLAISAHTGTHIDAPFHFIADGPTVETLDLNVLHGPALVIDLPGITTIHAQDLESAAIPPNTTRLLIKTDNSNLWPLNPTTFVEDYIAIESDAAQWLVDHGVKLIGVDYLSVAPFHDLSPTHKILLGSGIIIVEGLDLSNISPKEYLFTCLPLKLLGADGAPARAILVE